MTRNHRRCSSLAFLLGLTLGTLAVIAPARGQTVAPAIQTEIDYANTLTQWGLPDYAEFVLNRIRNQSPEAQSLFKVVELQGLIARGKFDEAKAVIARQPDPESQETWTMKLSLADGYYAWGRYGEARGIYTAFFQKYPDGPSEAMRTFYADSSYRYAQMLILMGAENEAVAAYRQMLKAKLERHVRRQALGEMCELLIKQASKATTPAERDPLLAEVDQIISKELIWIQDLWFGKSVVMLAHIRLLKGDIPGAEKLLKEYETQLLQLDATLREQDQATGENLSKLSPMAQAKYLLGVLLHDEAEKLIKENGDRERIIERLAGVRGSDGKRSGGAYEKFVNVFAGYPGTAWAADAGVRMKRVEELLIGYGAKLTTKITPEQMALVERHQFQEAKALFNQQQFAQSIEAYTKVLSLFPEGEASVMGLGDLARAYMELQNEESELYFDMTTRYLAERFGRNPDRMTKAGDQMLRLAEYMEEIKRPEKKDALYQVFFTQFPDHPLTPATILRFGDKRLRDEDYAGALPFYRQVAESYSNAPLALDALNRMAICHAKLGDFTNEIATLETYIERVQGRDRKPGQAVMAARFRLAYAYKQADRANLVKSIRMYDEIAKLLADPKNPYQSNDEEAKANQEILEGALFFKGLCLSMLTEPADKLKAYRQTAIKAYEDLLARFPKSRYAPGALSQMGTLLTVMEQPEPAQAALKRLQEEYPDTREARESLYVMGRNLLELGLKTQAIQVFKQMFAGDGRYSDSQIMGAGHELLAAGEAAIALEAFDRVLANAKDRAMIEPANLAKAEALNKLDRYGEAAALLTQMLKDNPNSGYTVQIGFALSKAYAEQAGREKDEKKRFELFNEAVKAMKTVRRYEKSAAGKLRSDVEAGRILELKAQAEKQAGKSDKAAEYTGQAAAAYLGIVVTAMPPVAADLAPHYERAFFRCVTLLGEVQRWADVQEEADRYLEMFPGGKFESEIRALRGAAQVKLAVAAPAAAPAPK